VVRIAQDGARDVVFAVPEDKRSLVRIGQAVQVRPGRMVKPCCKARCARWRPVPTGDAHLHRQGGAGRGNVPPLGATVHVLPEGMGRRWTIKLPTAALRQEGGQTAVWVYDPQTRTVTAAAR
jgi:hypothetical protein